MEDVIEIEEKSSDSDDKEEKKDAEDTNVVKDLKGSLNPNDDQDTEDLSEKASTLVGSIVEIAEGVMVGKGHLLCTPLVRWNLLCMIWMWSATIFTIFTINFFLKYVPGGVFLNFSISGFSEILANIFVGAAFKKLKVRWTFVTGFVIATIGGALLLFQNKILGLNPDDPNQDESKGAIFIAIFVLFAKFGCSMC
jgi:hypothetical protein